jgi:hypothetical protein
VRRRRTGLHSFDLRGIPDKRHRTVVQGALNACDYPFIRIRRATRLRVPVTVADTSRYSAAAAADGDDHDHADDHAQGVHPLTDPADARRVALGLFWLPTTAHPAGRIQLSPDLMGDIPLAQEVFLAEAAHAVDYGVMNDAQRAELFAIVHGGDTTPHGTHGWWEERGGQNYWADWVGETFMALFMRAFAPSLPRPLEARQPWTHRVTDEMARQARAVLLR